MDQRTRRSGRGVCAAFGAVALALLLAQGAQARTVTLRWSHPSATDVDGFRVAYGTSSGSYTTTRDIGRPTPSSGVFSYNLTVGDTETVYVALTAYGAGFTESLRSNEKRFDAPTQPPPGPSPIPLPPGATSTWSQSFETTATGSHVPGWLDTGAGNGLGEDDSLFQVTDLGGSRVITTSSSLVNIHAHLVTSGSDQWSAYGLQGRMRVSDASGGIGVTMYSQYPRADIYYRLRRENTSPFEISPHPNGAAISCVPANAGVVPAANTWYRFRLETAPSGSTNVIRAKVWREGTAEPGSWQTSCIDARSARPTRGTIGLWSMGPGQKLWDDLTVYRLDGGGAPPPAPILLPPG